jgi:short-subunit dehydrogenase
MKLDGAVVVIAGGASGIGMALSLQLAARGARVVVANRAGRSLETYRHDHPDTPAYETDLTQAAQVEELVREVVSRYGSIDYFINSVGIVQGGEVRDTPLETAQDVLSTNLESTVIGTHYVYRQMVKQGSGHLVMLASAAGLLPTPMMAYYTMTKYGIVGFCHALRAEARDLGVKVSVVCPGFVKTPIYEKSHYDNVNKAKAIDLLFHRSPIQSPEQAAARIIRGIGRNQATIHTWWSTRVLWWGYRLSPAIYVWLSVWAVRLVRRRLKTSSQP